MTKATDPRGKEWIFTYFSAGDISTAKDPLNNETKYEWDPLGNLTKVTDPRGKVTSFSYASGGCGGCGGVGGRLTKVTDPLNNYTTFAYDANENVTRITDAKGVVTDFSYNESNRLTKVESPSGSGNQASFAYNILGQLTLSTDYNGKSVDFAYDHMGRLTSATDDLPRTVSSLYTDAGMLSKITDAGGLNITYAYDNSLRLISQTHISSKIVRYLYDAVGRMTKVGAGASGTTDPTEYFFHGTSGLMTKVGYTSGASTKYANYAYDTLARVTKLTDWIDNTDGINYKFDDAGRLTKLVDYANAADYQYAYDAAGNVTSTTDFFGYSSTYTYTDRSELSTITAPGSKIWDFDYNVLGQPDKVTLPNGMISNYDYDERNRLTRIKHKEDSSTVRAMYKLELDDQGLVQSITDENDEYWLYDYDDANRLTFAGRYKADDDPLDEYTYIYAPADNLATKQVSHVTYSGGGASASFSNIYYRYNAGKELTKRTAGGTDTLYAYDDWGQLITKYQSGGAHAEYAYHYGGLMTKATSTFGGEGTVTYEFGADGKRRERTAGADYTWYSYAAGFSPVNEEDSGGTLNKTWVGGLAEIASSNPSTGAYKYYLHDQQGSTRERVDQSKATVTEYEYTPYGELYASSGSNTSRRYVGMDNEAKTDLLFTPFRMYNPEMGRFTSRDPLLSSPNVYAYGSLDPIGYVDPMGDVAWLATALGGAAIGGVLGGIGGGVSAYLSNPNASWGEIGSAAGYGALRGAVAGGVMGATFGLASPALAAGGLGTSALVGAGSAAAGEVAAQALDIATGHACEFNPGQVAAAAGGGALGAVGGNLLGKALSQSKQPVFWSGGPKAENAARAFANANNGIVLGDTVAGRALAQSSGGWSQLRPQWVGLSENFARGASGDVHVFQNANSLAVNSIWKNEYNVLIQNQNVTGIVFHLVP